MGARNWGVLGRDEPPELPVRVEGERTVLGGGMKTSCARARPERSFMRARDAAVGAANPPVGVPGRSWGSPLEEEEVDEEVEASSESMGREALRERRAWACVPG